MRHETLKMPSFSRVPTVYIRVRSLFDSEDIGFKVWASHLPSHRFARMQRMASRIGEGFLL